MDLYHYTLGFPHKFNPNVGTVQLTYTRHAIQAATTDRYGAIQLPASLKTGSAVCIEVGLINHQVAKLVYRMHYSSALDLCIVVVPNGPNFRVLTVWLNLKADQHETLNTEKYCKVG